MIFRNGWTSRIGSRYVRDFCNLLSLVCFAIPLQAITCVLQALPTKDGWQFLKEAKLGEVDKETLSKLHLSTDFQKKFYESSLGKSIRERLDAPHAGTPTSVKTAAICRYKNSWLESVKLLSKRELTLWWRDRYQIKAKIGRSKLPFSFA